MYFTYLIPIRRGVPFGFVLDEIEVPRKSLIERILERCICSAGGGDRLDLGLKY